MDVGEFRSFDEIARLHSNVVITEKVHGSNAQILIADDFSYVNAGSRTKWLTLDDDNYGFARRVYDNAEEVVKLLGPGRHFGEWYGSGINSGYGLKEKRLALFNTHRWSPVKAEGKLPSWVDVVPVLYQGPWKEGLVPGVMEKLKAGGSQIAPGFMKPEGIVIRFDRNGAMFKHVFEVEETGWCGVTKEKRDGPRPEPDLEKVAAWLQPIRFEKLLSRDEKYQIEYPASLPLLAKDYVADLEKEEQLKDLDEPTLKSLKRGVFPWIKLQMKERGFAT